MSRQTLKPGDGVLYLLWPNATLKRGYKPGKKHCPVHAGCGESCKDAKWHALCVPHMQVMAAPSDHRGGGPGPSAATRKPDA